MTTATISTASFIASQCCRLDAGCAKGERDMRTGDLRSGREEHHERGDDYDGNEERRDERREEERHAEERKERRVGREQVAG
jgi:hypothetical protein